MAKFSDNVTMMLKVVNAGNLDAVPVLADALEESGDEERARAIRLDWLKMSKGVESLHKAALKGDKADKEPVAEVIARWYAWALDRTRARMGNRSRLNVSYATQKSIKAMLPVAWATVRAWREEAAGGGKKQ